MRSLADNTDAIPYMAHKMKTSIIPILLLFSFCLVAKAQAVAVPYNNFASTTNSSCVAGSLCPLQVIPGATVNVCGGVNVTLSVCLASLATTYTDSTAGTACPTTAQLWNINAESPSCVSKTDNQGNLFFWAAAGQYSYYLTVPRTAGGKTYGPYPLNIGASTGCPSNATCDANYATLPLACSAAGSGTLYLTRVWAGLTTQTFGCIMTKLGTGAIKPASGQVVTFAIQSAPLATLCDMSAGGSCLITSSTGFLYPQWFNSATPIQSALVSSGYPSSPTGTVVIPKGYPGSEVYTAATVGNIIDCRLAGCQPFQFVTSSRPITGFPLGGDLNLDADGSADMVIGHDQLANAMQTTTTSIATGTQNITVQDASKFATSPPGPAVEVGYGTDQWQECAINSITLPTTLNITCTEAFSYSGTTSIWQGGNTVIAGHRFILLQAGCPAQATNHCPTLLINGNQTIAWIPSSQTDAFPYGAFRFSAEFTCMHSVGASAITANPDDCNWRNADNSHAFVVKASDDSDILRCADSGCASTFSPHPSTPGTQTDGTASFPWEAVFVGNNAPGNTEITSGDASGNGVLELKSTDDAVQYAAIAASLVTGSGTTDTVSMPGVTSGTVCSVTPTNTAALGATLAGVTSKTTNQVTVTHQATANLHYDVICISH